MGSAVPWSQHLDRISAPSFTCSKPHSSTLVRVLKISLRMPQPPGCRDRAAGAATACQAQAAMSGLTPPCLPNGFPGSKPPNHHNTSQHLQRLCPRDSPFHPKPIPQPVKPRASGTQAMLCAADGSGPSLPPEICHPSAPALSAPPQHPQDLATCRGIANPATLHLETQCLQPLSP